MWVFLLGQLFLYLAALGRHLIRDSASMNFEEAEQRRNAVLNHKVDHGEIQREDEDRDYDHRGRGSNFFPRGRGHLAHFSAHVVIEVPGLLGPGLYRRDKCVLFRHGRHLLLLSSRSVCYACAGRSGRKLWQGRRDSNPQVRFWRPTV